MLRLTPSPSPAAVLAVAAIILSSTICLVSAQAPSPAPFSGGGVEPPSESLAPEAENECLTPLFNMTDCLSYVTESSNATVPDKNCCPELAGLIDSNPICLCQLLGNSKLTESFGIKIDVNRALKLPSICRVTTPPVSLCSAVGYPVPGPMSSEESPSPLSSGALPPSGVLAPEGLASSPSKGSASKIAQPFILGLAFSSLLTFF
ncbi:non-specific lipid transfer protein GPI-anchored 2-like [Mercurialis annua]|uniref:non-specific lipid transfer protein GPI-anchored 2-like n=1 Tax=Mercurialis annua TaxID=3986 RepID=UPI00215E918B|nr:non-specific lipid transfer protein GPI-anchored 2-like [Mercurialis annua]